MLLVGAVVVLGLGGLAWAGDYHYQSSLICSDCHTMHYSQQHTYAGAAGQGTPALADGPNSYLLRQSANNLCLACHNGVSGIPDVLGTDFNSTPNGGRQAGALNNAGDSGDYAEWKGHSLGAAPATPPGGTWPSGLSALRCNGCHATHGNSNYRNLGGKISVTITYGYSTGANNDTDVRINLASLPAVGSRISGKVYSRDYTFFNEVSGTNSPYGDLCGGCHGNFHGTGNTGTGSPFTRHPTEAINFSSGAITQYAGKTNRVQVLAASNPPATWDTSANATPSCMSCHKAHGNKNPFGLIYMTGTGTVNEEGVSGGVLRDLCGQCHGYGN
jgi:hypothetical protein